MREALANDVLRVVGVGSGTFVAVKADGSVVTWGQADCGGDHATVREALASNVQHITGTRVAFATVKTDDSVVA